MKHKIHGALYAPINGPLFAADDPSRYALAYEAIHSPSCENAYVTVREDGLAEVQGLIPNSTQVKRRPVTGEEMNQTWRIAQVLDGIVMVLVSLTGDGRSLNLHLTRAQLLDSSR